MTAAYQRAAEWKNGGICGRAHRKRKSTVLAKRGQCRSLHVVPAAGPE